MMAFKTMRTMIGGMLDGELFSDGQPHQGGWLKDGKDVRIVIRCDKDTCLIWKWHPQEKTSAYGCRKDTEISDSSLLQVKAGQGALLIVHAQDGVEEEYMEGPAERILQTDILPVMPELTKKPYPGSSSIRAEIYFINVAEKIRMPFAVPYFDLPDPKRPEIRVPTAVRGRITFHIADVSAFIRANRLQTLEIRTFQREVQKSISGYVKRILSDYLEDTGRSILQLELETDVISGIVEEIIIERLRLDFAVEVLSVDLTAIELDKASVAYGKLLHLKSH